MIDKAKVLAAKKRYRERHKDQIRAYNKRYMELHPDYRRSARIKEYMHNYYIRTNNKLGTVETNIIATSNIESPKFEKRVHAEAERVRHYNPNNKREFYNI